MDKLASKLTGGHHGGASGANKEDYVDKGLDSLETKYSHGKLNPHDPKVRQTNERITDSAREKFESVTGKHVPSKISN
ncbi:hypothetical protein BDV28DRAFT_151746 [Aspergillus coremiiformis]|uniref:Uncharacterized protein n=1 Tax=Aspergillus coremiiformis TaxID=138285 RepID=A0A5N6YVU7_9EURO|nr:hypothetical protein BDV28DRAFT_151746 [Aspergillus coremiiformis]